MLPKNIFLFDYMKVNQDNDLDQMLNKIAYSM